MKGTQFFCGSAIAAIALISGQALAQTDAAALPPAPAESAAPAMDDIVVTANRRSERVNDVAMSITAASAETLNNRGVTDVGELSKLTPGLTYSQTAYSTPVFTLRGIGFNENTLAAAPNVAVYVDEIPLPYPAMTTGALLDPERVEVLKGPQGILYGQNSTGGAINFIAAKPGSQFAAGLTTSIERFGLFQAQGFAGGPITDTLGVRVAVGTTSGGAWQRSYTRNDTLGDKDLIQGRMILEWEPTDRLKLTLNVNGWSDRSETQAPQVFATRPAVPARAVPGVINYPLAPSNARDADWTPGTDFDRNADFIQTALRVDYGLTDTIQLTALSSYSHYKHGNATDADGTSYKNFDAFIDGKIDAYYQEVRLIGDSGPLSWVLGGNYANDKVYENQVYDFRDGSTRFIGGAPNVELIGTYGLQKIKTSAGFGQVGYEILPNLKLEVGARYTNARRSFEGCTRDAGNGLLANASRNLQLAFAPSRTPILIPPGGCVTMANTTFLPGLITGELNEDNVSWRAGANWKVGGGVVYANVSRGYKAGSFPTLNAFFEAQYEPAKQEQLTAYEIGFKQSMFNRLLQLNVAGFYYDYRDKQVRGRQIDPIAGSLVKLLNIPKSRAYGAEAEFTLRPATGITITGAGTYLDSKIKNYTFYNNFGVIEDFSGDPYPFSSKWSGNIDFEARTPVSDTLEIFGGATVTAQSSQRSALGADTRWDIPAYALVDFRAGVETDNGRWKVSAFVRNAFDKYYWTNALYSLDTFLHLAGRPRTYGLSLAMRFGN